MDKWQPIKTAPKDGWFWLWVGWRGACVGRRSKNPGYKWEFLEHLYPVEDGHWPKYRLNALGGKSVKLWMPLPEPPYAD